MSNASFSADGSVITVLADFDATPEQLWKLFENPRLLEKWWGPPSWPATFSRHEFHPDGEARYHMTGPDGTQAHGWWQFHTTTFPIVEFTDGFSDSEGVPDTALPTNRTRVEVSEADGLARMTLRSEFESPQALATVLDMGMQEGMTLAMGQIDDVLAG